MPIVQNLIKFSNSSNRPNDSRNRKSVIYWNRTKIFLSSFKRYCCRKLIIPVKLPQGSHHEKKNLYHQLSIWHLQILTSENLKIIDKTTKTATGTLNIRPENNKNLRNTRSKHGKNYGIIDRTRQMKKKTWYGWWLNQSFSYFSFVISNWIMVYSSCIQS